MKLYYPYLATRSTPLANGVLEGERHRRYRLYLSRPDLIKEIKGGRLRFDPPVDLSRVEQVSIDLLLGTRFARFKKTQPGYLAAVHLDNSIWESLDIWENSEGDFTLGPGEFVLAQTLERVTIPNNLVGLIEGRSSCARLGLTTHLTAPKIDPGFEGNITLEIANLGGLPIKLRAGVERISQLMLVRLSRPLSRKELYGSAPSDVFQNQTEPIPRGRKVSSKKAVAKKR
jgi:dCTP deaminase